MVLCTVPLQVQENFHRDMASKRRHEEVASATKALAHSLVAEDAVSALSKLQELHLDAEESWRASEVLLSSARRSWSASIATIAASAAHVLAALRVRDVLCAFAKDHGDDEDASVRVELAASILCDRFVVHDGFVQLHQDVSNDDARCLDAAARIASIPERFHVRKELREESFVALATSKAATAVRNAREEGEARRARILCGAIAARFARRGHAKCVAEVAMEGVEDEERTEDACERTETVLELVDDAQAMEMLAWEVLRIAAETEGVAETKARRVEQLLGKKFEQDCNLRSYLSDVLLTGKVLPLSTLRVLMSFLYALTGAEATGLWQKTFSAIAGRIVKAWSNRKRIVSSSKERQVHLTSAVCIALEKLHGNEVKEQDGLLGDLLQGVSMRLESPYEWVREHGMVVANLFASLVDPSKPLVFDELAVHEEKGLELLLKLQDNEAMNTIKVRERNVAGDPNDRTEETCGPSDSVSNAFVRDEWLSSDSDDDSDFEGNLVPNIVSATSEEASGPRHLKTLMVMLRKSDEPTSVGEALQTAESLIRCQPDELAGMARELAGAILHAKGPDWEDEGGQGSRYTYKYRYQALVAMLVHAPRETALRLCEELYSPHLNVSQRVMLLDIMGDAAKELSYVQEGTATSGPKQRTAGSLAKYPPKTRVFGERSLQQKQSGRLFRKNRFVEVVPEFMLPLMKDFDARKHGVDFFGIDYLVLGRLVTTLGLFVECSSVSQATGPLCQLLLELMRAIGFHEQPFVRRSVLAAGCSILVSLPTAALLQHTGTNNTAVELLGGLDWLQKYAASTTQNDADEECRMAGAACLQLFKRLGDKAKEELSDDGPTPHLTDLASRIRLL